MRATWPSDWEGLAAQISAAMPAAKGDEKLVPLTRRMLPLAGSGPVQTVNGAKMSTSQGAFPHHPVP